MLADLQRLDLGKLADPLDLINHGVHVCERTRHSVSAVLQSNQLSDLLLEVVRVEIRLLRRIARPRVLLV
jgi:hypothetical protein